MSASNASSSAPLVIAVSSINIDETFQVPHIVRPGETLSSSGLTTRSGGKGANVSVALALSGTECWFVGSVGKDAPWPLEELRKRNVRTDLARELEGVPTGRAFIQIAEDGENSIVLLKGANFPPEPLDPATTFSSLPRKPTHVVLQNEIPLETTAAFQSYANAQGCATVWNPSPLPRPAELKAWKWNELDILIVNQGEGLELIEALSGEKRDAEEDAEATMRSLASLPALGDSLGWIVMTRGAQGVLASVLLQGAAERTILSQAASRPEQVVDTTGAGDTFAGYLVSTIAKQQSDAKTSGHKGRPADREEAMKCLRRAKVAAAMAVEKHGATESIPDGAAVDKRSAAESK
ncbi:unnamed protein product [Parajaminaea phylloscopi]